LIFPAVRALLGTRAPHERAKNAAASQSSELQPSKARFSLNELL